MFMVWVYGVDNKLWCGRYAVENNVNVVHTIYIWCGRHICCGEHIIWCGGICCEYMQWVTQSYAVETYSVGYIMWMTEYMLWVTYGVGYMMWTTEYMLWITYGVGYIMWTTEYMVWITEIYVCSPHHM